MGSSEIAQTFTSGILYMSSHLAVPLILFIMAATMLLCSYLNGRKKLSEANAILHRCPECGSSLVVRSTKEGERADQQFYACSKYPECTFTSEI
jgi:predicted RNA-binding Zn-ribbon protein involved in translation (DUF1610 family)